jgi:phosphohistidine phosphatase SixA
MRRIFVTIALAALLPLVTPAAEAVELIPLTELAKPGRVLIMRHALAPGVGDSESFKLRDCATQRNLDSSGRAQAVAFGKRLARAGVTRAMVYSSQWCRCLDTARLLDMGAVEELLALNSFFRRPQDRDGQLAALRAFLARLPVDGVPIILVTHQVTISALTGHGAASGGGVILALDGTGDPRVLGAIEAN